MDDTQLTDLKQFIVITISQQVVGVKQFVTASIRASEERQLDDLKQFVAATVSQSEERVKQELKQEFGQGINGLRQEMRDGFAGIGAIIESHNDQLDNHEGRLDKLESKAA